MALRDIATRGGNTTVANNERTVVKASRDSISRMEEEFAKAMPRGLEAQQLVRDALTVISAEPRLLECTRDSVLGGLMTMAQLGLRPGVLGHGWLLPLRIKGELCAQLIIGYMGFVELAQRSGVIESISTRVVRENDFFDVEFGTSERIVHRPCRTGPRGENTDAYAVVRANGGVYWEWMSQSDLEEHRDRFAMARSKKTGEIVGPWKSDFWAMSKKTVVKRALKLAPRSTMLVNVMAADETVRVDLTPDADIPAVVGYVTDSDVTATVADVTPGADQCPSEDPPGMDPWATDGGATA